jgi:hypothetical protein
MILFKIRVVAALHDERKNVVNEWLDDLGDRRDVIAGVLNVRLSYLREEPRDKWEMPFYRAALKGYREIGEIRFKCFDTPFRVFGFFGPMAGQYTLLGGATHKKNQYNPTNAIDNAERHRKRVLNGERKTEEYNVAIADEASGSERP